MLESFKLWITKKGICSHCNRIVKKSEFAEDKFKRGKYNYCKKCQLELKKKAKHPHLYWDGMKHYHNKCPYCKSTRIRVIHWDSIDNTGNIWKCSRCHKKFMGYILDEMFDKALKRSKRRKPKPTKNKNVAQLKCWVCGRVFRQDNHKFLQSGRCPSCDYFGYNFLRFVEPRKMK